MHCIATTAPNVSSQSVDPSNEFSLWRAVVVIFSSPYTMREVVTSPSILRLLFSLVGAQLEDDIQEAH